MLKETEGMKIAVAGTGYVGLSNAVLLTQHYEVFADRIFKEENDINIYNALRI